MVFLSIIFQSCISDDLSRYLHKDTVLRDPSYPKQFEKHFIPKPITAREAAWFAVQRLKERGVKQIEVCELHRVVAPLGGFIIDSKGSLTAGEKNFSVFRVGIRDGTEDEKGKYKAGEVFVFIAMGKDDSGKPVWYPEPGPDYKPAEDETAQEQLFAYEFLGGLSGHDDRADFENLSSRFK